MRILLVLVLAAPLGGCLGLSAPKPLPDWAMSPQAEPADARAKVTRSTVARRAPEQTATVSSVASADAQPADPLPFSREWQSREDAADLKLRRTMNICRGC